MASVPPFRHPTVLPFCRSPASGLPSPERGYTATHIMKRDDLLDLNDVLQHPGRELAVDISTELPEEQDIDLLAPLEGYLEAVSTGNILLVTGSFGTRAVLECARCNGPLQVDVDFELDEQFPVEGTPSSLNPQDCARVVSDEPFPLFEGNSLIVEQLLRQSLVLALPMQSLCEFGWEGECPVAAARGVSRRAPDGGRLQFNNLSALLKPEDNDT